MKHPFQKWVDDNDVIDVQFFPKNLGAIAVSEMLDDAYRGIVSYENGETVKYIDPLDRNET